MTSTQTFCLWSMNNQSSKGACSDS